MSAPKWDTDLGKQMWKEGKSDRLIAAHFGISASTVAYQRQKKWENHGNCPPPEDTPLPGASPEETKEEAKEETSAELPSGTTRQPEIYEVLEMATGHLNGIQAICTAEAILQLWNWESREELLKARNAVDYLLKKMEET